MKKVALWACCTWSFAACVWSLTPKGKPAQSQIELKQDTAGQEHVLRVCNAYTSKSPMEVSMAKEVLTGEEPIPYKSCREMKLALKPGADIEFTFTKDSKGVFELTDLPAKSSILLLVAYRSIHEAHDNIAFLSHVFSALQRNASQVLVLDSFNGPQTSHMLIAHQQASDNLGKPAQEQLHYEDIATIDGGDYKLELVDDESKVQHSLDFAAHEGESYVALRVGGAVTAKETDAKFAEELMVYPKSKPHQGPARSAARAAESLGLVAVFLVGVSLAL